MGKVIVKESSLNPSISSTLSLVGKIKLSVLIGVFLILLLPRPISAKDYSIDSADFIVQLKSDGSAYITETRIYNFDGSFSWADEWIPLKGNSIKNYELWEGNNKYKENSLTLPGNYSINVDGDKFYIKWYYVAQNEERTFTSKYVIQHAVTNHSDISEFYWQLVGDEWTKGTKNVSAKVYLPIPAPSDKIWAFGHGPTNGKVSIVTASEVDFSATNLPPKKFFEVRVLFPKLESVASTNSGKQSLTAILAEERGFQARTKAKGIFLVILLGFLSILPLWRFLYWFNKWRVFGDDAPLPEVNLAGKLHEPPSDLEPVLVETLLAAETYKPSSKSVVATIIDLVRKKILSIEREEKKSLWGKRSEYILLKNEAVLRKSKLGSHELKLIHFLFGYGVKRITFNEMKNIAMRKPTSTRSFWEGWQKDAFDNLIQKGFIDKESKKVREKLSLELIIYFVLGILYFTFVIPLGIDYVGGVLFVPIVITIVSFLVLIVLVLFMYKRTDRGNWELASWKAFKVWLKDYSVTKNYPIDSVILWEKYLVYGAALGISLKALSELPIKFSEAYASSNLYVVGYSGGGGGLGDVSASFANLSSAMSGLSVSFSGYGAAGVGGAGGFSGGGGGAG